MGKSKNKKRKETGGLQPKGGAYALQDAQVAAEGLDKDMLGEGILSRTEVKEAKRVAKETHKAEIQAAKEKAQKEKDKKAEKKKKGGIVKGVREMGGELRKVRWPSFGTTMKQTGVVLSVVFLFGLVVFGLDRGLGALYDLLMSALK